MKQNKTTVAVVLSLLWTLCLGSSGWASGKNQNVADESPHRQERREAWQPLSSKYFLRQIYFWDTRDFTTFKPFYGFPLPGKFHFFGFTNINSTIGESNQVDMTGFFTEARLTSPLWYGGGVQTELNSATGQGNTLLRFGTLYKRIIKPYGHNWTLVGRVFPLETDGDGGQASLLYDLQLYKNIIFLDGTVDYNWRRAKNTWVIEPLLTFKLYKVFRFAVEYRLNSGRPNKKTGVAFGLEVKFVI